MRGDALSHHTRFSTGSAPSHSVLARGAVRLAVGAAVAIGGALALFGVAYGIGGPDATADNWVGIFVVVSLLAGLFASLAAFALAIVAKASHERWALLWLPLSVFPAVIAFLVLGEALWWE